MVQSHVHRAAKVVVVEDDDLVRDLAVSELTDSGYVVVDFETADEALPYIEAHNDEISVVVTDVQMPGRLNGLQFAQTMSHRWPKVPVLVTSGGPLVDPRRLPACATFLPKPWFPSEIVERVRTLTPLPA